MINQGTDFVLKLADLFFHALRQCLRDSLIVLTKIFISSKFSELPSIVKESYLSNVQ